MAEYYLGIIRSMYVNERAGITKEFHAARVDIPEFGYDLLAFPRCGELDEPKPGDPVLCLDLDPLNHSYIIYEKLKENGIIGFRSSGKVVDITPEKITIGVYEEGENNRDTENEEFVPESKIASIELDKDGNINITSTKDINIVVNSDNHNVNVDADNIIFNDGLNGGLVNIDALRNILTLIKLDLVAAGSGANLTAAGNLINKLLEDTNIKH